jgi:hypothetical protein
LFEFENVFDLDSNLGFKFKYAEKKIAKPLFIFTRPKSSGLKHPWQPSQIFRFSFHSFNEPTHRLAPAQPASLAQLDAVAHLTHSHPRLPPLDGRSSTATSPTTVTPSAASPSSPGTAPLFPLPSVSNHCLEPSKQSPHSSSNEAAGCFPVCPPPAVSGAIKSAHTLPLLHRFQIRASFPVFAPQAPPRRAQEVTTLRARRWPSLEPSPPIFAHGEDPYVPLFLLVKTR